MAEFFTTDSVYINDLFVIQDFIVQLTHFESGVPLLRKPGSVRLHKLDRGSQQTGGFFEFCLEPGVAEMAKNGMYKVYSDRDKTFRPTDPAVLDKLALALEANDRRAAEVTESTAFIAQLALRIQYFMQYGHGG